jgi:hypothetical protein
MTKRQPARGHSHGSPKEGVANPVVQVSSEIPAVMGAGRGGFGVAITPAMGGRDHCPLLADAGIIFVGFQKLWTPPSWRAIFYT